MPETVFHINLDRFNPAQREAIVNTEGPTLVIAGAGSGKTSVLTTRIALLVSQGVAPESILALTFTKKAADEMRNRIISLTGPQARRICMGTFHSVFIRFLRSYANEINFPENFTILDEDDSLACLKRCIDAVIAPGRPPRDTWTKQQEEQYKDEDKHYKAKTIREIISRCKNELITADEYASSPYWQEQDRQAERPLTGQIFLAYRNTCHRMCMMDFDDILLYTDMLLANNPYVRTAIACSFRYILVDEYQDTNKAQYAILKKLTLTHDNICVVGDDSQSIYAFRGARIQNILNFQKEYPHCRMVKLEQNYRSTKTIVSAANNLISNNRTRIKKECFTDADRGSDITLKHAGNEKEEARYIASKIIERRTAERLPWGDFAVLYRTNAQSRAIEEALVKSRIPYVIYSGTAFFSRMEIKDLMAYFKLAVNPHDNESFARVVNKPARGFGEAMQRRLFDVANACGLSLWDTATNPNIDFCNFTPKALKGLKGFVQDVLDCIDTVATMGAYDAAKWISDCAGFYQDYMADNDPESVQRANNIRELVDAVRSYEEDLEATEAEKPEEERQKPTLAGFLQNALLLSNADTGPEGADKVSIMTVHCAKGLEFDTVFVAGMEDKLFPLEMAKSQAEMEEERRLFYVAVTRAKRNLHLTRACERLRFGKRETTSPSRFIAELSRRKPN